MTGFDDKHTTLLTSRNLTLNILFLQILMLCCASLLFPLFSNLLESMG